MRLAIFAVCVVCAAGLVGCTKSKPVSTTTTTAQPATASTAANQPAPQPIAVPANAAPEQVMNVFLHAWRSGDSATMDSLLTTKAREELAKHQVHVDPLSSPNAVYRVEPARLLENDTSVANINSVWTEQVQNEQGQMVEERYAIVWALRHQANGWRVAGMQMELVPGQVQAVNFEDPAAMLQKMAEANAALNPPPAGGQPTQGDQPAAQTAQQSPQIPAGQQAPPRIER